MTSTYSRLVPAVRVAAQALIAFLLSLPVMQIPLVQDMLAAASLDPITLTSALTLGILYLLTLAQREVEARWPSVARLFRTPVYSTKPALLKDAAKHLDSDAGQATDLPEDRLR